jgi:hypothetical protein
MVSFQKNIKEYHTVIGDMFLIIFLLLTSGGPVDILGHPVFRLVQIMCPDCSLHVAEDRYRAHVKAYRREAVSRGTTPTFSVSINSTAFDSFFNHENVQGERLTLIQRSTIVALNSLNIRNDVISHLTHCDQRTIQHWIDYYNQNHSLEDEPRSGTWSTSVFTQNWYVGLLLFSWLGGYEFI